MPKDLEAPGSSILPASIPAANNVLICLKSSVADQFKANGAIAGSIGKFENIKTGSHHQNSM